MTRLGKWSVVAAGFLLFGLGVCWTAGNALVRPSVSVVAPAVAPARDLTLKAADGLAGWLIEPGLSLQALPRYGVWPGRIAPLAALRRFRGPVFVIGGGADRYTPPAETREMFAAAPGPKSLWIVDGLDHAAVSGTESDEYRARILGFLGGAIGRP